MLVVSRATTIEQASQCSVRMQVDILQGFDDDAWEKERKISNTKEAVSSSSLGSLTERLASAGNGGRRLCC